MEIKMELAGNLQASSFHIVPRVKKQEDKKKENEKVERVEKSTETQEDKKGL